MDKKFEITIPYTINLETTVYAENEIMAKLIANSIMDNVDIINIDDSVIAVTDSSIKMNADYYNMIYSDIIIKETE